MAATVSSPWSKPGAWALDAEEHEAELQQQEENSQQNVSAFAPAADFPSLSAAAATRQPKKKKNQTLSLAEFSSYKPPSQLPQGLTHEDLINLPTGPRERSAEELERSRLGGGFKSYGLSSYRNGGDESSNSRWGNKDGNSRVSDREFGSREPLPPSRADEIDDWSKGKKSTAGGGFESRREMGSGFESRRERDRGSFFDSQSKADESDSWVANKPSAREPPPRRYGASSGGFEKRGSFDSLSREKHTPSNFGAADSDNWGKRREESNGAGVVGESSRPKLVLQPRSLPVDNGNEAVAKPKGSNPFGEARPREKVLAEPGKDYKEIDEKLESLPVSYENVVVAKPKGSNPFGEARPREEVLAEQGKDYKEIDEKLESMKISKELEKGDRSSPGRRGSFGNGRVERAWRKPDSLDSGSRPQSADNKTKNGDAAETAVADETGVAEEY